VSPTDIDELLHQHGTRWLQGQPPPPSLHTAVGHAKGSGRSHMRYLAIAASVMAVLAVAAVPLARAIGDRHHAASPPVGSATSPVGPAAPTGTPATWFLAPKQDLGAHSTKFTAMVSELACASGQTGKVLPPEVRTHQSEVVVTFRVVPNNPGANTCPSNNSVPYEVDLDQPLGNRSLVDGQCLNGSAAASTSFCVSGSTRYTP
jgi:hypothetical protein